MVDEDSKKHESEVQTLLQRAEQQMRAGQLTKPPGDSAYETYRQVLRLDPQNAVAKDGIAKIVAHYEEQSQQRRDEPETQLMQQVPLPESVPQTPRSVSRPAPEPKGGPSVWKIVLYAGLVAVLVAAGLYFVWPLAFG